MRRSCWKKYRVHKVREIINRRIILAIWCMPISHTILDAWETKCSWTWWIVFQNSSKVYGEVWNSGDEFWAWESVKIQNDEWHKQLSQEENYHIPEIRTREISCFWMLWKLKYRTKVHGGTWKIGNTVKIRNLLFQDITLKDIIPVKGWKLFFEGSRISG